MIWPLVPMRLHGWLDDLVALTYVAGILLLGLSGAAAAVAVFGAVVHFTLTRLTDYPQGTWKKLPFRAHGYIELGEGLVVLAAAALLAGEPLVVRGFLAFMGFTQVVAFGFSDYGAAVTASDRRAA